MTDVGDLNDYINDLRKDHECRQMEMAELCASLISRRPPEHRDLLWIEKEKYIQLHTSVRSLKDQLSDREEEVVRLREQVIVLEASEGIHKTKYAIEYGAIVLDLKCKIRILERKLDDRVASSETLVSRVYKLIRAHGYSEDGPWDIDLLVDILDQNNEGAVIERIHEMADSFSSALSKNIPVSDIIYDKETGGVIKGCSPDLPDDPISDAEMEKIESGHGRFSDIDFKNDIPVASGRQDNNGEPIDTTKVINDMIVEMGGNPRSKIFDIEGIKSVYLSHGLDDARSVISEMIKNSANLDEPVFDKHMGDKKF